MIKYFYGTVFEQVTTITKEFSNKNLAIHNHYQYSVNLKLHFNIFNPFPGHFFILNKKIREIINQ